MNITVASYHFNGHGLLVQSFEVVRETEKCYFTKNEYFSRGHRFLKEEMGKIRYIIDKYDPRIQVDMADASKEDAMDKLSEWFTKQADRLRRKQR